MTCASLFAGIGGFDLALERLGHQIVFANEWDNYAGDIYDKHFSRKIDRRDITTIDASTLPEFDMLVGGFPCQAFSVAGKRRGFDDTRGTLFFDVARILKSRQPKYFILENVKGLLSHDEGNTIRTIFQTLDELGYDLQWQVCNSKDFGVPQNRERIFIVGNLRGITRPEVFPIPSTDRVHHQELARTDIVQLNEPTHSNNRLYSPNGLSPTLNTAQGGNRQPKIIQKSPDWRENGSLREFTGYSPTISAQEAQGRYNVLVGRPAYGGGQRTMTYSLSDTVPTIRATQHKSGDNQPKIIDAFPMRWKRTELGKQIRRNNQKTGRAYTPFNGDARTLVPAPGKPIGTITSQAVSKDSLIGEVAKTPDKVSNTIRSGGRGSVTAKHAWDLVEDMEYRIRRLTPTECERLQGFPDGWTTGISDTQRYKCLGNAVTVNVVEAVASRL